MPETTSQRTPAQIAADARTQLDNANTAFVPVNILKIAELSVEFMESTAAVLVASGLVPANEPSNPS